MRLRSASMPAPQWLLAPNAEGHPKRTVNASSLRSAVQRSASGVSSSSGIGFGIATHLARLGAHLIITGRDPAKLVKTVQGISVPLTATVFPISQFVQELVGKFWPHATSHLGQCAGCREVSHALHVG